MSGYLDDDYIGSSADWSNVGRSTQGGGIADVINDVMGDIADELSRVSRRDATRPGLRERLTRERDSYELVLRVVSAQLERRELQLRELDRYPTDDPFADGDTLHFTKTFPNGPREYSYAAYRTNGLWYVTGSRAPNGASWEQLVNFMGLGVRDILLTSTSPTGGVERTSVMSLR